MRRRPGRPNPGERCPPALRDPRDVFETLAQEARELAAHVALSALVALPCRGTPARQEAAEVEARDRIERSPLSFECGALDALIATATASLEELIVTVDANKLQKLGSLAFPTGLRRLTLNISARRKISLKPLAKLAQFAHLEELSLKGSFTHLSALRGLVELQDAALFLDEPNELDASKMTKLCRIETWTEDKTLKIHGWKPPAKKR